MLDNLLNPNNLSLLSATGWIDMAIWAVLLVVKILALVDSLRWTNQHYVSAGKQNRTIWLVLLGASLAFHLIASTSVGFLAIAGDIASIVYLVDVRPALQQVSGRGGNRNNMGPYGPW